MLWEGYIAVILSFALINGAHPTTIIPGIKGIETFDDLNSTHDSIDSLLRSKLIRRRETKIVHIQEEFTKEDIDILLSFSDELPKDRCYHPKLVLLFHSDTIEKNFHEWPIIVEGFNRAKRFEAYIYNNAASIDLRYGDPRLDSLPYGANCGCIFPEALLENFDVDVIFPSTNMFRTNPFPLRGKPEVNKKLFSDYFGWKEEKPIKLAIIFSRIVGDTSYLWAKQRAQDVSRWLRSLPEGEQMLVYIRSERFSCGIPSSGTYDKDIAVLLFGGDAILVDSFFVKFVYSSDDYEMNYRDRTAYLEARKVELEEWKTNVIDKWPQNTQRIAFMIADRNYHDIAESFRNIFRNETQLIVLPTYEDYEVYELSFVIVGFPEL